MPQEEKKNKEWKQHPFLQLMLNAKGKWAACSFLNPLLAKAC